MALSRRTKEKKVKRPLAIAGSIIVAAVGIAQAVPIHVPLDKAIQQADIVVVGTLGKLAEGPKPEKGVQKATGTITVTQVLKGPADTKEVSLQTHVGVVDGPIGYKEGASGIWILTKIKDSDTYRGGNGTSLQPVENLNAVKAEIEKQKE